MSTASSSSVGNMPPRHGKKLADVMDEAFKTNNQPENDDGEDEKSERHGPNEEAVLETPDEEPVIEQPKGFTMSSVYPPQPCERCVRSKKTCKGIAGARCEHCKALHQKCSNSTGPPRGRHAVASRPSNASKQGQANGSASPKTALGRPKRKAATKSSKSDEDEDDELDDDDEEIDVKAARTIKKPRVGNNGGGPRRSRLLKDVAELEVAIKKLQTTFSKDMAKLQQIAASITSEIRELDEE